MRYTVDERHERILELVRERGSLRVTDLADLLGISTVTARRDVETLASGGRLHRVRGAVSWPGAPARAPLLVPAAAPGAEPVVGMVLPQAHHYFGEIIRGAREAALAAGARLVLGFSGYQPERDVAEAERMRAAGADGLLLAPSWLMWGEHENTGGLDLELPTVLVERRGPVGTPAAELDRVCSDHAGGAGLAIGHLVALGHRRIALVAGRSPTAVQVQAGYEAALRTHGLTPPPGAADLVDLYEGQIDHERLEAAADRLAAAVTGREVTAALVQSDADAIVLLQRLRTHGIRVPEDLALVAYDDTVAALSELPLTAVAPPKYEVGQAAVRLLLQRLGEGKTAGAPRYHLDLLPELHVRASCGTSK